jgi:hypothetical protein
MTNFRIESSKYANASIEARANQGLPRAVEDASALRAVRAALEPAQAASGRSAA